MILNDSKNPSSYQKYLHLAKIAQIGGASESPKPKAEFKIASNSRSAVSNRDITALSANSRDTTLETHQTQEFDDYSKKRIEKEADTILEGEFDDQISLSSIKDEPEKKTDLNKKKKPQKIEYKKINRTPGIISYLSYLQGADDYELGSFRQKMKEKLKLSEINHNSSKIPSTDAFLGTKLHEAIVQRQKQENVLDVTIPKLAKNREFGKNLNKNAKLKILTSNSAKDLSLTRDLSLNRDFSPLVKGEKINKDTLKENLQTLAKEYEMFMNYSSRQRAIYEEIKGYISDKPEMMKIFYNKKAQRFRESLTHHEIYRGLLLEAEVSAKGSIRLNRRESNHSPLLRRKTQALATMVKIPDRLYEQIKFFTAELQAANLNYQLQEIKNLGDRLEGKVGEIQNKYFRVAKKLYTTDRKHYNKFCELKDSIEQARPYLRLRLDDKLTDFEKHAGELPLLNSRTREISKAWDNLLFKWTNSREKIIVTDNS